MSFVYVHLNGPNLEKLFRTWHQILTWYEDETGDFPYWYLERTNIGHLALAVYQLGGVPVQEFSCVKGKGGGDSSGRADLYMSIPTGRRRPKNIEVNIEAKQHWCSVRFNEHSRSSLGTSLASAVQDCRNLKDTAWKADLGAGIVFILPYSKSMPSNRAELRKLVKAFTQSVSDESERLGASFLAFHYPSVATLEKISRDSLKYDWCPGIAVIGKFIK